MKNNSLKIAFLFIPACLLLWVLGSVFGGFLYTLYSVCTRLVAGQGLAGFSPLLFVRGIFLSMPLCLGCTSVLLILYMIRRPSNPVLPLVFFCVLTAGAWAGLMPVSWMLYSKYDSKLGTAAGQEKISAGYFRTEGDMTYYYSKINDDGTVDGVAVNPLSENKDIYTFTGETLIERKGPFTDSLIESTVEAPSIVRYGIGGLGVLMVQGARSIGQGYGHWLCFASLGFALLGVVGLRRCSSWKMLDVFIVIAASLCVLVVNGLYYGTSVFSQIAPVVDSWYKWAPFMADSFIVTLNVVGGVVMLVTGLVLDLLRKNDGVED